MAIATPLELAASSASDATYDVSADGRIVAWRSDAVGAAVSNRIHAILNWPALLRDGGR